METLQSFIEFFGLLVWKNWQWFFSYVLWLKETHTFVLFSLYGIKLLSSSYCLISSPPLDPMLIFLWAGKEYPEESWVNILGLVWGLGKSRCRGWEHFPKEEVTSFSRANLSIVALSVKADPRLLSGPGTHQFIKFPEPFLTAFLNWFLQANLNFCRSILFLGKSACSGRQTII